MSDPYQHLMALSSNSNSLYINRHVSGKWPLLTTPDHPFSHWRSLILVELDAEENSYPLIGRSLFYDEYSFLVTPDVLFINGHMFDISNEFLVTELVVI